MDEEMMQAPNQAPEDAGRSTDTVVGHLSLGEVVIPRAMLDDPNLMGLLQQAFQQSGLDIAEFTVGDPANKINPETGYPEFFKLGKLLKIAAPLALSYFAPGLGSTIGSTLLGAGQAGAATLGSGLLGAGLGALTGGGLKGALTGAALGGIGANIGNIGTELQGPLQPGQSSLGYGGGSGILGSLANNVPGFGSLANGISSLGDSVGSAFGTSAGSPLSGDFQGPTQGSGLTGALGRTLSAVGGGNGSIGGLSGGSSGGGSTFNSGSALASALGGFGQQDAIKKAQKQLLAANQAQQANIGTFDPSNITNDAGYQFNLAQGQQGLDRQLAAGGNYFSGDALKASAKYNQDYANNALNSAYGRYTDTTGAKNQLLANQGNIQSQGTIAGANGLSSALSGVLNPTSGLSQQDLLRLLSRQQGTSLYG